MSLFHKAARNNAFLKAGFFGREGCGKTTTACRLAIGLHGICRERGLPEGKNPILFADTEKGSDWMQPEFDQAGIELLVSKTRAFDRLVPMMKEAERSKSILIIDSLTHFWDELKETYLAQRNRENILIQDWAYLRGKKGTGGFNLAFAHTSCHIIWCSRQQNEWAYWTDEAGHKQMESVGKRPRADADSGHEPDLLVWMRCLTQQAGPEKEVELITAKIKKDRSKTIMGQTLDLARAEPDKPMQAILTPMEAFGPHINALALGGQQRAVEPGQSDTGAGVDREIVVEEIAQLLKKYFPSKKADDQESRFKWMEWAFKTRTWSHVVHKIPLGVLRRGRDKLWKELEGEPYEAPAIPEGVPDDLGLTTADKIAAPKKKQAKRKRVKE